MSQRIAPAHAARRAQAEARGEAMMRLLARGLCAKQIAPILGCTDAGVRNAFARLCERYGVGQQWSHKRYRALLGAVEYESWRRNDP